MNNPETRPPVALDHFIRQMGISPPTAWRWRKAGMLHCTNICGRNYILPEQADEFRRRASAGEFAKMKPVPTPPRKRQPASL